MKNYFVITSISLLLMVSCNNFSEPYHLPPKDMRKVLQDIQTAEAYSTMAKDSLHHPGPKNMDSLSLYYKEIFAHYHITTEQFNESLDWYKQHPAELDSIYNNILNDLNRRSAATPPKH